MPSNAHGAKSEPTEDFPVQDSEAVLHATAPREAGNMGPRQETARSSIYEGESFTELDGKASKMGSNAYLAEADNTEWERELTGPRRYLRRATAFLDRLVPPGGHASNIFNQASTSLGVGIVSMASGFNGTGVILSIILMLVCMVLMTYSFYLIGWVCQMTPYRSWESACRHILFPGADYVISFFLLFLMFGVMTSYVISVHDLIGPFIGDNNSNSFLNTANGHRLLTATVWFFGMLMLSLPRRLATLRYFSILGVGFIVFFVFCVIGKAIAHGMPYVHEMKLFSSGLDAVNGLTLYIFAFLGHALNFKMYAEMRVPSARNLCIDCGSAVVMIGCFYFLVGFFGYADIGPTITGSIFQYYDVRSDPLMCVAYIGILMKVCVAYALCNQGARLPIYYMLRQDIETMPYWHHVLIVIPFCLLSLLLGLFIPDITIVFNLIGSLCGGVIGFLTPVFCCMFIGGWTWARVGPVNIILSYMNLIAGVVAIVFGTAVTIDTLVKTYK